MVILQLSTVHAPHLFPFECKLDWQLLLPLIFEENRAGPVLKIRNSGSNLQDKFGCMYLHLICLYKREQTKGIDTISTSLFVGLIMVNDRLNTTCLNFMLCKRIMVFGMFFPPQCGHVSTSG